MVNSSFLRLSFFGLSSSISSGTCSFCFCLLCSLLSSDTSFFFSLLLDKDFLGSEDAPNDSVGDKLYGAQRVIIAWDDVIDTGRVRIGIDESDDRNAEALCLTHCNILAIDVYDKNYIGHIGHVDDTRQVACQLGGFATKGGSFALAALCQLARLFELGKFLHAINALANRLIIRKGPPEPTLRDIVHISGLASAANNILRLPLCADKQNLTAIGNNFIDEITGTAQAVDSLTQIEDMNPITLPMNE